VAAGLTAAGRYCRRGCSTTLAEVVRIASLLFLYEDLVMKKNKNEAKRLSLSKETLAILDPKNLEGIAAAAGCGESRIICSIVHTCVSCQPTDATCA
jgi:hypothetical protein